MQTVIRTNPHTSETRVYHEYTPQELEAVRMSREMTRMVATGHHKSALGSMRADEFIPDTGHKTLRHKVH